MESLSSKKALKFKLPSKMKKIMKIEAKTPPKRPPKREKNTLNFPSIFNLEKTDQPSPKWVSASAADPVEGPAEVLRKVCGPPLEAKS